MAQTILTTQTPAQPNNWAELSARTFGFVWRSAVNGTCTGGRYYGPTTAQPATVKLKLHRLSDQVLLASKLFASTVTGWNSLTFDTPIAITAGVDYVISYYMSGEGNYAVTPSGLTSAIVNGDLTAVANGGRHKTGSGVDDFPVSTNSDLFFVDVNVETGVAGSGRVAGLFTASATGRKVVVGSGISVAAVTATGFANIRPAVGRCSALVRTLHRRQVARPNTGTVSPPSTGVVVPPFTGIVVRP